jgi:DNA-binding transcriptional LysR family regulator
VCYRRRVDLEALRAFLAVVETGSFLAAANQLRWSRATLRRRVDELEVFAGVLLLHRSEQGATATAAGELLARRGRVILSQSTALLSSVREVGAAPSSMVRVALPVGMPPRLLALLYAMIRATHGMAMHVRTVEDPLALLRHDVDMVFSFGDEPLEGSWVSQEVVRVEEHLVATPSYLAAHGTPSSVEELLRHDILMWEGPEKAGPRLPLRRGGDVAISPKLTGSDIHTLRHCAGEDLGILFGPDAVFPDGMAPGPDLVPVLDELVGRQRVLRLVYPASLPDSGRLTEVLALVRSFMPPVDLAATAQAAR